MPQQHTGWILLRGNIGFKDTKVVLPRGDRVAFQQGHHPVPPHGVKSLLKKQPPRKWKNQRRLESRWLAGEGEKRDLETLALKLEGPQVQERGDPQKLEEAEERTVPSESPKEGQLSRHLDFSPVRPVRRF